MNCLLVVPEGALNHAKWNPSLYGCSACLENKRSLSYLINHILATSGSRGADLWFSLCIKRYILSIILIDIGPKHANIGLILNMLTLSDFSTPLPWQSPRPLLRSNLGSATASHRDVFSPTKRKVYPPESALLYRCVWMWQCCSKQGFYCPILEDDV